MKIKTIRSNEYFIDTINVNVHFPIANASMKDKKEILIYVPALRKYIFDNYNYVQSKGISVQKSSFPGNVAIHYRGTFFKKTRKAKDDIKFWFSEYLKLEELVMQHFNRHCRLDQKKYTPKFTVSRFDFAKNHKGNMTNSIPVCKKSIKTINYYAENTSYKPYIYGLSIGKRQGGIFFRSYDKRFDKEGWQTSLERFGEVDYVRKEWELKREGLRPVGITTPYDLLTSVSDKKIFTEIIYRCRKARDIILKSDGVLYKSIHNELDKDAINKTDGFTLQAHEFNKMIKRDYSVFLNRPDKHELERHAFNPFPQIKGLLKREYTHEELIQLFNILAKKIIPYDTNKLKHNPIVSNTSQPTYEESMKEILQYMKDTKKERKSLAGAKVGDYPATN